MDKQRRPQFKYCYIHGGVSTDESFLIKAILLLVYLFQFVFLTCTFSIQTESSVVLSRNNNRYFESHPPLLHVRLTSIRLIQMNLLLLAFSLVKSTSSYNLSNNDLSTGDVTNNKNIYHINSSYIQFQFLNLPKQEKMESTPNSPLNFLVKPSKPETGGGEVKEDVKEVKESTCACGRTDVQEPIHFDYTSRLALTGI